MSDALSSRPSPRRGRNDSSDGSARARDRGRPRARVALGAQHQLVERARLQHLALEHGRALEQHRVGVRERLVDGLSVRPAEDRRELDELQVAHDAVVQVDVGVQPQVAERARHARHVRQQLVAQLAEGRVQRLVGPEQLLVALVPGAADRGPRLLDEGRRRLQRAALGARAVGQHERVGRRASCRGAAGAASRRRAAHASAAAGCSCSSSSGIGSIDRAARARHARGLEPEHEHVAVLAALRHVEREHVDRAGRRRGRIAGLAHPGLRRGGEMARELATRGLRVAPRLLRGELADPRQADEALRPRRPAR